MVSEPLGDWLGGGGGITPLAPFDPPSESRG